MIDLTQIVNNTLRADPGNGPYDVARAAAVAALRWAADRAAARCVGNDNPQMQQYSRCIAAQADALAHRQEAKS